jgi:MFS family permease
VQTSTDDKLRGRVGASLNTVVSTTNLVSMALAGVLASMLGVREVFVIGGLVTVLAGFASAVVFRSSRAGALRQSETPGTAAPLPANLAEQ